MPFYQGFTLDTLLGAISVLLGIIALIVGGAAYHNCKVIRKSFNDKKEFGDNCEDNSQKSARDIINNNCDVEALTKVSAANFEVALTRAYNVFDQQAKSNLQQIIEETNRIIQEQKPNIAGLTKVDWINIYFESAKNTSDEYMQKVWAKVLAKELECPGSFSYKTLDVLKNMSADDFRMFEKMCTMVYENYLVQGDYLYKSLTWAQLLLLSEFGLLSVNNTKRMVSLEAGGKVSFVVCQGKLIATIKNKGQYKADAGYDIYTLSSAACELLVVAEYCCCRDTFIEISKVIKSKIKNNQMTCSLFDINWIDGEK